MLPLFSQRDNRDRAFAEVVAGIRRAIENPLQPALHEPTFLASGMSHSLATSFSLGAKTCLPNCMTQLKQGQTAALSQAISGLGGVGKTQLAVEYAYRYHQDYQAVLWAHAESVEVLTSSYTEMATLLNLPVKDSQEQAIIIQA